MPGRRKVLPTPLKLLPPLNPGAGVKGRTRVGAVRTGGVPGEPPGNTTLPKLRVIPGVVAEVPPGKTTLPKLRVMVCAKAVAVKQSAKKTPAALFIEGYPFELYRRLNRPRKQPLPHGRGSL